MSLQNQVNDSIDSTHQPDAPARQRGTIYNRPSQSIVTGIKISRDWRIPRVVRKVRWHVSSVGGCPRLRVGLVSVDVFPRWRGQPPEGGTANRKLAFSEITESGNFSPRDRYSIGRGFPRVCRAVSWNHATTSGNPAAPVFIPRLAALYSRGLVVCRGRPRLDRLGPLFRRPVRDFPVR